MTTTARGRLAQRIRQASNPFMLRLAGGRWSPFAVLEHRGRRSGGSYAVPVEPAVTPRHVVIGLPWGPQTNWALNVVAAGGCDLRWRGRRLHGANPRVVGPEEALPLTTGLKGRLLGRLGIAHFLVLDR